jgi:hypothetical protein
MRKATTLLVLLMISVVSAATPRAYVGLVSFGAGVGYHHWSRQTKGTGTGWLGVGAQFLEGTWFFNPRLGLGLRACDVTTCEVIGDTAPHTVLEAWPLVTVSWVLNPSPRRFGFLCFGLEPYLPNGDAESDGTRTFGSAVALDYCYVPLPPWPLEGRVRLAANVFKWSPREIGFQVSAGIKAGLGWWFMKKE